MLDNFFINSLKSKKEFTRKRGFFWQARSQILLWYVSLMLIFTGFSLPILYTIIFYQVDNRVKENLKEEIESFEEFQYTHFNEFKGNLDSEQIKEKLDRFLDQVIPEDDNFLITIVDKKIYRSVPKTLPKTIENKPELMKSLLDFDQKNVVEYKQYGGEYDELKYTIKPIVINEQIKGLFVAIHIKTGERSEAFDLLMTFVFVLLSGLIIAFILAWLASDKILRPLRSLAKTANRIDEFDLKKRIDITGYGEIYDLTHTFNEMMNRLEFAFESQRNFLNDAGHELRTPITIIQGHLELMGDDPQEQKETIALVLDEIDRMNRLVNDLTLLAKYEMPDFLHKEVINVSCLVEDIYKKAIGLGSRKWLLDNKATINVIGDRQRLIQALMNLVRNAVQHTTENSLIIIGSNQDKNCLKLWVQDTGKGIETEEKQHIFERFYKGKAIHNIEGSGLGLSIVKAIVEAHNGWVECISEVGKGATFTIYLPINDTV
ncbi:MAG: HAMP domain-containing sensor histidine kinase [Crocosphaera sp.]|nr:HAMP domain-containing sensor histidine kinase [Crocosphaera sp.]